MSSDVSVSIEHLSKCYQIYDTPRDRLKQFVLPRVHSLVGQKPRRYFREFWALKDVSLKIQKGETVGIIGRNGSGKSTLLQMICGTLNPTYGKVQANGRVAALLELGSGFNSEFTGRENVYMNAAILGLDREEIEARFDEIAAFADIGDFLEQPVKSYSSGMVVRLAFAVQAMVDPDILVVDEALAVGDEFFQRKCFSRIETLRNNGTTILFVSHSGATIIELCDRAVLLDAGDLLTVGPPKRVVTQYQTLLYAPVPRREAVRNSIAAKSEGEASNTEKSDVDPGVVSTSAQQELGQTNQMDQASLEESFDPSFVPRSDIIFEPRGAQIVAAAITTPNGRQVNGLVRGKSYRFKYEVSFDRTVTNVRFGMLIKTATGMPLGGGLSAPSLVGGIAIVDAGTRYSVEYSFSCYLNPGVYFLNAGVFGCDGSPEEVLLHRKADVLAFRVLPIVGNCATEIVDFGLTCRTEANA